MLARAPHHRIIQGLKWARPCERPVCIPRSRSRGVRALGLSYERLVGERIGKRYPRTRRGQWFEFEDSRGRGYCQIDVVFPHDGEFVVLECKLADVFQGLSQIEELYLPIVRQFGPARGVVVVKHVDRKLQLARVCTSLREAIACASATPSVLHWIGKGPL
jgi:hypothetical protein